MERACPVCLDSKYEYWFRPSQSPGPVVQCKTCRFVYINPIETKKALIQEGPILGDYPSYFLESSNLKYIDGSWEQKIIKEHLREIAAKEANARDVLACIENLTKNNNKLLDIGCFCGVFLNVASQEGWDCYGIEPLVMPAIYARGKYGLRVVTDTLRKDTYPPESFDVVTAFQVFEHFIHPNHELEKINRILKKGGLLVIEVPNIDTVTRKLLRSKHRHFVQDHVSFFSAKTLSLLLSRAGFQVRKVYYPTRAMSLEHILWWLEKYCRVANFTSQILPKRFLENKLRINLRDIVTVIARKVEQEATIS